MILIAFWLVFEQCYYLDSSKLRKLEYQSLVRKIQFHRGVSGIKEFKRQWILEGYETQQCSPHLSVSASDF